MDIQTKPQTAPKASPKASPTSPTATPPTRPRPANPATWATEHTVPPREPRYHRGDIVAEHTVEAPSRHALAEEILTVEARYAGSLEWAGVGADDGGPRLLVAIVRDGKTVKSWPMPVMRSASTSVYGDQLEVGDIVQVSMLRDLQDPIQVSIRPRTLS